MNNTNLVFFQPTGEIKEKLSRKPLQFVVEQGVHDFLMAMPSEERIPLLRKWVQDGARALMEQNALATSDMSDTSSATAADDDGEYRIIAKKRKRR